MQSFVMRVVINTLALWLVSALFPSLIYFQQGGAADYLIAGLVLGLVNAVLRPILVVLTLPINVLTLGLFTLVINAIVLQLVAAWTRLETGGFLEAIIASLVLGVASTVISSILGGDRQKRRA
jgi:putative membrane protein